MSSTIDLDIGAESVDDAVSEICAPVAGWDARKLGERLVGGRRRRWTGRCARRPTGVRAAQLTRLCPEVAGDLADGRLGVAQVFELGRARANPRVGDPIADAIDELVGFAKELDFDGFRRVVRRWEQLTDVDGAHRGHEAAHRGRRATLSRFDDSFH